LEALPNRPENISASPSSVANTETQAREEEGKWVRVVGIRIVWVGRIWIPPVIIVVITSISIRIPTIMAVVPVVVTAVAIIPAVIAVTTKITVVIAVATKVPVTKLLVPPAERVAAGVGIVEAMVASLAASGAPVRKTGCGHCKEEHQGNHRRYHFPTFHLAHLLLSGFPLLF
jgi:hypothetical protein